MSNNLSSDNSGSSNLYSKVKKVGLKLKGQPPVKKPKVIEAQKPEPTGDSNQDDTRELNDLHAQIKRLVGLQLTRAEKAHRLALLHRREEILKEKLEKTHAQRVAEFNQKLNSLGERKVIHYSVQARFLQISTSPKWDPDERLKIGPNGLRIIYCL